MDALLSEEIYTAPADKPVQPTPDASPPKPSPTEALDARLEELIEASRTLSEPDRRTVVALLDAFVLKARIAALAGAVG